ncbi:MAG: hypothetical protein IVW51_09595 [Thermaceae bacterium]|nr:hypothetical protein [Thermaceae bacterium]
MRGLIRQFDALLRRIEGVFEFCDDPNCLLRLQLAKARHPLHLEDLEVPKGTPVLELHLWNEHLPPLTDEGPNLLWASRTGHLFVRSLQAVAQTLQQDSRLAGVRAVGGYTALLAKERLGGVNLMRRLGFQVMPYGSSLGRFGEFWENLYSWWLIWAFNQPSLRQRKLLDLQRAEIWMSVEEFLRRYSVSPDDTPH